MRDAFWAFYLSSSSGVDWQYLLAGIVTVGMQLLFFSIAATLKFDKVTDIAGSMNFVVLAILSLVYGDFYSTRQIVATVIVVVSRVELGLFLLYRVLKRGKDSRFDEMREHCGRFFGFWVFQMIWVWGVSISVLYLNSIPDASDMGVVDIIGAALAGIGFLFEFLADVQKHRFRGDPANAGKVCDVGVWSITRHPNYFGEILLWWGIFMMTIPVIRASGSTSGLAGLLSPLLTMVILLFLSGMPTSEGPEQARFMKTAASAEAYLYYRRRTAILIPMPHFLWVLLPRWFKVVFCCEFPMYEYQPPKETLLA